MNTNEIIRAWKDADFRDALSAEQVPAHPAGTVQLSDDDLGHIAGGLPFPTTNPLSLFPTLCEPTFSLIWTYCGRLCEVQN